MLRCAATWTALAVGLTLYAGVALASPQEDLRAFQGYFQQRFPDVPLNSFVNGAYAIDAKLRAQWHALMQFPPYSFALDRGKQLFHTAFDNGSSYAGCLANGGVGIKQNYPYFDTKTDKVVTLALAINRCRTENGEQPLPYKTGDMAAILAYMAYTSRGNAIDIKIPQDPAALAAYRAGKEFYYSRHGQLNFSCASCHVQNAGKRLRAETLSPALGPPASFPVYRSKWGGMGTLHRRFSGCLRLIRAEPFPPQSQTYRNLEYFLMYMSNGLPVAGPASRP